MPETSDELDSAVQRFFSAIEPEGGLVTKFFVVAEGISPTGERYLDYGWSADLTSWDHEGMLRKALDAQPLVVGIEDDE